MKRFLTLAVLFLLLIGTMPVAHAQESIPEVSTLSELQDAIAQAIRAVTTFPGRSRQLSK